jgi:hypothetical protein
MAPRTVACATALFVTYRDRQRFGAMRACHHRGRGGIAKKKSSEKRKAPGIEDADTRHETMNHSKPE